MRIARFVLAGALAFGLEATSAAAYTAARTIDGIWLDEGETLRSIAMPTAGPLTLDGWTRQGRGEVFRLTVKAGRPLRIGVSSRGAFVRLAIFDFRRPDDDAIFFSEDGKNSVVLTPKADTDWLIRPVLILGSSRRGLGARYELTIEPVETRPADKGAP